MDRVPARGTHRLGHGSFGGSEEHRGDLTGTAVALLLGTLPRRKRRLLLTAGLALVFLAAAAAGPLGALKPEPGYRAGEKVEGLTAELSRSLPPDYPKVTFLDVTQSAGITLRHFSGRRAVPISD